MLPSRERLEQLFDKPYGSPAPTEGQWREFYAEGVHFIDPTQEKQGLKAYLDAQEGLVKRCDDVMLKPAALAIEGMWPLWNGPWA